MSDHQKENNPPDDGSDPLVTADNTTCEEFSRSEDDTLNGNEGVIQKPVSCLYDHFSVPLFLFTCFTFFSFQLTSRLNRAVTVLL